MTLFKKPISIEYPPYMQQYVDRADTDNILESLITEHYETIDLITSVDEETLQYRYAPDKWNIKEIIQHIMDAERVFNYRALRFARKDQTNLPGFDENAFAIHSHASMRHIHDMVREFSVIRAATVELFKSFDEEMCKQTGHANGKTFSVNAFPYIVLGHELHHRWVIEERYLPK
jgi:hypothetical protein